MYSKQFKDNPSALHLFLGLKYSNPRSPRLFVRMAFQKQTKKEKEKETIAVAKQLCMKVIQIHHIMPLRDPGSFEGILVVEVSMDRRLEKRMTIR